LCGNNVRVGALEKKLRHTTNAKGMAGHVRVTSRNPDVIAA